MKIGITGSDGMLGWHMRCFLKQFPDIEVILANRKIFSDHAGLREFVSQADTIAHFAGQNRGVDAEIASTNPTLAEEIVEACERAGVFPHIVYASTTHVDKASAYGQSKRRAAEVLNSWADSSRAKFSNVVLPHVFGEGTKPFYNSVVATFAYQLATNDKPFVKNDAVLELVHAQDVCAEFLRIMKSGISGNVRIRGQEITVSKVLQRLQEMANSYQSLIIPDVREPLNLRLFNLYRSYLFPDFYPKVLEIRTDNRGSLIETVKNRNGGQAFISTTKPGVTRGNHYHYRKIERFLVLHGQARIEIRRLFDLKKHIFDVCGDIPSFIDMPALHTHNITNSGAEPLLTLFWSNEIFDPDNPDTVHEPV